MKDNPIVTAAPAFGVDRKMANNFDKFRLLMWKNGLLQWRHKVQTIIEIMVPVMFSVILILIRSIVDPDIYPDPKIYKPFEINTLDPLRLVFSIIFIIFMKRTRHLNDKMSRPFEFKTKQLLITERELITI